MKKRKIDLEERFGRILGMTARTLKRYMDQELIERGYDITFEQAIIMMHIRYHGGLNQQHIADIIDRDKTSTTRFIDILEERNLVTRIRDRENRRQNIIHLTTEGDKKCREFIKIREATNRKILKGIDPGNVELCKDVLRKVYQNLSG